MAAASTAFLMGHRPAAAGLAMKAVLADPASLVYQNNLAAILTQTGYPEKAIPYLNTLRQVKPGNSTLNNNLGYAWFYLGKLIVLRDIYKWHWQEIPHTRKRNYVPV